MDRDPDDMPRSRVSPFYIVIKVVQELFHRLPVSFYLLLAIIVMLLLGIKGFSDLEDPRKLAFTMVVFMIFFAAVVYRALVDAVDIARKHFREDGTLMNDVFERDGFSTTLNRRQQKTEKTNQDSTKTPPEPPAER